MTNANYEESTVKVWNGGAALRFHEKRYLLYVYNYLCRECLDEKLVCHSQSVSNIILNRFGENQPAAQYDVYSLNI